MKHTFLALAVLACLAMPASACPGVSASFASAGFGFNSGFVPAPAFSGFSFNTFATPVPVPVPVPVPAFNSGFRFNLNSGFRGGFGGRGGRANFRQVTRVRGRF